jgi:hypothetical protein
MDWVATVIAAGVIGGMIAVLAIGFCEVVHLASNAAVGYERSHPYDHRR